MNVIDVLLFPVILLSIYSGYQNGFIPVTLDLDLLVLGLIFAFLAFRYFAEFFGKNITSLGVWTRPLAFILLYIFGLILLGALARKGLQKIPPRTNKSLFNKAFIFPGVINGLTCATIVSALLISMAVFDELSAKTRESSIANALTPHVEWASNGR